MQNILSNFKLLLLILVSLSLISCSSYQEYSKGSFYGIRPIGPYNNGKVTSNNLKNDPRIDAHLQIKEDELIQKEIAKEGILPPKVYDPELETPLEIEKAQVKEQVREQKVSRKLSSVKKNKFDLKFSKSHFNIWKNYYVKKDTKRFQRQIKRGLKYRTLISDIFATHGLPKELFFVGLIESGYSTRVRSHAGAVGPWQFIKGTATRYGLKVDSRVDERYHIVKSTHAAAGYFKDLYNIFGSWELALCAYNAGEYRIINAIRKGNTRDYTTLVKKRLIPRETAMYIPKVAAAMYLHQNDKKFQFNIGDDKTFEDAKFVVINKSFSFKKLSRILGKKYSEFKKLNPDVKRDWIKSSSRSPFRLTVKKSYSVKKLATLIKKIKSPRKRRSVASSKTFYRIKRGDNLSKIARKFSTSVRAIKRLNGKRSSKILIGQRLKVPSKKAVYTVRRGDNLTRIAKRFGTTVRQLLALNSLKKSRIYPNQRLFVPRES